MPEWVKFTPSTVRQGSGLFESGLLVRDPSMPEALGLITAIKYMPPHGTTRQVDILWQETGLTEDHAMDMEDTLEVLI